MEYWFIRYKERPMTETKQIFAALNKAQGEMKPAVLDCKNPHFNSRYASLQSVVESIREPFAKNGLSFTQSVQWEDDSFFLETCINHSDGSFITSRVRLIVDRNNMQGLGSAITYARRYCLAALAGVVDSEDDDGNSAVSPGPKPIKKPPEKPKNYAPQSGPAPKDSTDQFDKMFPPEAPKPPPPASQGILKLRHELFILTQEKILKPELVRQLTRTLLGSDKFTKDMTEEELSKVIDAVRSMK